MPQRRLSERVEPILDNLDLPSPVAAQLAHLVDILVEHIEALEDEVPRAVIHNGRTEKGPMGPTQGG